MMSSALPKPVTTSGRVLLGELRRALGHETVLLSDENAASQGALHDHLATIPKRVRHLAAVPDWQRRSPVAVADTEVERLASSMDRARDYLPGELVGLSRLRPGQQLGWLPC